MDHQTQSSPVQHSPPPVSPFRPSAAFPATTPPASGAVPQRQPSRLATTFPKASPDALDTPSSLRAPGGGSVSSYSPHSFSDSPISIHSPKPLPFDMAVQATPRAPQDSKKRYPLSGLAVDVSRTGGKNVPSSPSANDYSPSMAVRPLNISRTISMDSSVSTSTSTTNQTGVGSSNEPFAPSSDDIARQIHTAGSAEAAIRRLLIETHTRAEESKKMYRLLTKQSETLRNMDASAKYYEAEIARYRLERNNFRGERDDLIKSVEVLTAEVAAQRKKQKDLATVEARSSIRPVEPSNQSSVGDINQDTNIEEAVNTDLVTPRGEIHLTPISKHHRTNTTSTSGSDYTTEDDALPDFATSSKRVTVIRATPAAMNLSEKLPLSPRLPKSPVISRSPDIAANQNSFATRQSTTHSQSSVPTTPKPEPNEFAVMQGRKGPPTPLNLVSKQSQSALLDSKARQQSTIDDVSDSDYDEDGRNSFAESTSDHPEQMPLSEAEEQRDSNERRGRRKTRAEDDADREEALARELEARSRSSKLLKSSGSRSKHPPTISLSDPAAVPPLSIGLAKLQTSDPVLDTNTVPDARVPSKASNLQPIQTTLVAPGPINPGLPLSPRPGHRLAMPGTLPQPRAPRDGAVLGIHAETPVEQPTPLTAQSRSPKVNPRSPLRTEGVHGGQTDISHGHLSPRFSPSTSADPPVSVSAGSAENADSEKTRTNSLEEIMIPEDGIYKGLVSENYPDLLIGPNALPLIFIKVLQSRTRTSRHSSIFLRGNDEEAIFTMGVFSRSSSVLLWKIEKGITSVVTLHTQLVKSSSGFAVQLPERSLFVGNAPAKVDARKAALENYLETMLDTPLTESGAVSVCKFLSSSVVVATPKDKFANNASEEITPGGNDSADLVKEGFLTKRGKNFGGWKSRYFVLNEPVLKWYDTPGGSIQGSIELEFSKVARLSGGSPGINEDPDGDSRHALVIHESKKKDSKDVTKHILCAESDRERDEWISAMLYYVRPSSVPVSDSEARNQAALSPPEPTGKRTTKEEKAMKSRKQEVNVMTHVAENESLNSLQAIGYSATKEGEAPTTIKPSTPHRSEFDNGQPLAAKLISAPTNGTVIRDPEAWNAMKPPDSPRGNAKDFKEIRDNRKRSIWGFRDRNVEPNASPNLESPGTPKHAVKPVFGLPLSEAVEFCMAPGSSVCLPAVVYRCMEYLEEQGALQEEGIFRLSGSNLVVKQLRERFNTEGDIDLRQEATFYDVHAVASLLKQYLRELPSSVLSRDLHVDFVRVLDFENLSDRVAGLNYLVHKLPLPNWTLLRALSAFMIGVVSNSGVNKMTMKNIGIVFVPTLNIPAPMLYLFLEEFNAIFEADPPEQVDIQRMTEKHTNSDGEKRRVASESSGGGIAAQMQSFLAMSTRDGSPLRPGSRGSEKGLTSKQRKRESNMMMMNMVHGLGLNSSPSRKDSLPAFHES